MDKMPLGMIKCVNMSAPGAMWHLIQGVVLPHAQSSRDRLQIDHNTDTEQLLEVSE